MSRCILRLEEAQIHKKYETFKAEVKFYSFTADEALSLPALDVLMGKANPSEIRQHVKAAARTVLHLWESVLVTKVRKRHVFNFGDTGKIVYDSDRIPERLDWLLLAVEIDEDIRNLGSHIDQILPDSDLDGLAQNVTSLFKLNPAAAQADAAIAIGQGLLRGVTQFMRNNKNDQVGLIEQSFVRELDYPCGIRRGHMVQDLTANMWYSYTLVGDDAL